MAEKMKPSGIDWIGDVPNEWDITKVKYRTSQIGSGTTPDSGNPLYYEDGCFPWIQSGDLYNADYIRNTEKKITELAVADFNALTWYEKEFVVVAMYGASVGNIAISQISSYTNQACCVLKAKDDDLRYLFYFLSAGKENMLQMAFGGTQPNISQAIIKNLPYLDVSHNEQQAIADFLDKECAQIDSIAADLEKQITLLQQYKKSLITETVTKGLDKSVPMKDSEVEWIGKIPEHWKAKRLKYVMNNFDAQRKPIEAQNRSQDGEILYDYYGASGAIDKIDDYIFDETSILIGEDGANLVLRNLPLIYIATGKYWVNNHAHILRPKSESDLYYMAYQMEIIDYSQFITGSAQPKLSQENLNNVFLVVPPLNEQQCIASYLEEKISCIDTIVCKKQEQLSTIQQHKKSLIYEYVTGKKRVKEVQ